MRNPHLEVASGGVDSHGSLREAGLGMQRKNNFLSLMREDVQVDVSCQKVGLETAPLLNKQLSLFPFKSEDEVQI